MKKQKLGKYYIDKEKVVADFGNLQSCINTHKLNWKKMCYGADSLEVFGSLPKEYILERDATPKIYSEIPVILVQKKSDATHILKNKKGWVKICKA